MIIDTSAIMSILLEEPEWQRALSAIQDTHSVRMAAPTMVELRVVAAGKGWEYLLHATDIIGDMQIEIEPFTFEHAQIAFHAYETYGKGYHPRARLNLGDCFSYALAKATGEPLLFVGDDFTHTDLISALVSPTSEMP